MNRFAEIVYGRVNYIFETTLPKEQLGTIFSPKTYWVDVTGTNVEVGWWWNGQTFEKPQGKNDITLGELKEQAKEKMKLARDTAESEPLAFKDTLLDFDARSRERLMFAIVAKEQTFWTDYHNQVIELSVKDLEELPAAIKARTTAVHALYNEKKALIEQATTKEEVGKVTWE